MKSYRPTPPPPESSISTIISNLAAIDALVAEFFFGPQPECQGTPAPASTTVRSPFINAQPAAHRPGTLTPRIPQPLTIFS